MAIKIGINGMGRIGRMILRSVLQNHKGKILVMHINNKSNSDICAKLLKNDSIHGSFNAEIKSNSNFLKINKHKITYSQYANIEEIKWKKYVTMFYVLVNLIIKTNYYHTKNGAKK